MTDAAGGGRAPIVVVDPGHGGGGPNAPRASGHSSSGGVRGPRGMREQDLTLALGRLLQGELAARGTRVRLTRSGDENPTLAQRIAAARAAEADVFVSLHFNASPDARARGGEVWVHGDAGAGSWALARAIARSLGRQGGALGGAADGASLRVGRMAALDPSWQAPATAACLVEVDYLTNPDQERRFAYGAHRACVAGALAEGIAAFLARRADASERFDLWHEVPLVPQLTGMSCWAAAAAMVVGWRDCVDVRPEEVARGAGAWAEYRDGLEPRNVDALGRTFGLVVETPRSYDLPAIRGMLERFGPLWVGAGPTGLHVVVVAGMYGDGSADGTFVRVLDPWPLARGERYTITFAELAACLQAATDAAGVRASILHCGDVARGRGARSVETQRYGTPVALFRLYRDNGPPQWPLDDRDAPSGESAPLDGVTTPDDVAPSTWAPEPDPLRG